MIEPDQPTRSASTVAGISGCSASNARTRSSNGVNDVNTGGRSYLGGNGDATAFTTVVREIPNRSAICLFGTPSPASLRINAQSSTVITLQSSSVHFSSVATDQFSSVADSGRSPDPTPAAFTDGCDAGECTWCHPPFTNPGGEGVTPPGPITDGSDITMIGRVLRRVASCDGTQLVGTRGSSSAHLDR